MSLLIQRKRAGVSWCHRTPLKKDVRVPITSSLSPLVATSRITDPRVEITGSDPEVLFLHV